jgi:hypothetical protein
MVVEELDVDEGGSAHDIVCCRFEVKGGPFPAPPVDPRGGVPSGLAPAPVVTAEEHAIDAVRQSEIAGAGVEGRTITVFAGARKRLGTSIQASVLRLAENQLAVRGFDRNRKAVELDADANDGRLGDEPAC